MPLEVQFFIRCAILLMGAYVGWIVSVLLFWTGAKEKRLFEPGEMVVLSLASGILTWPFGTALLIEALTSMVILSLKTLSVYHFVVPMFEFSFPLLPLTLFCSSALESRRARFLAMCVATICGAVSITLLLRLQ